MCQPGQAHHPGIDSVDAAQVAVPNRIVKCERRFKGVAALRKSTVLAQS